MAAAVGWYGPLIDLSAAGSHVGGFVQVLVVVRRILPHQEQNARSGRTLQKTMVEVGDNTRSNFSMSLWSMHSSSIIAGDVILLQNIKIVEFRNALEGRASQISAVQLLLHSKDLTISKGIDGLIINCRVGETTREKLRRVVEWVLHTKCTLHENLHQAMSKNWKEGKEKESTEFWSISKLLSQNKSCYVSIYAFIGEMMLMGVPTSHSKGHLSIIERLALKEHNGIVRDLITTGCKLCGTPIYPKNLPGDSIHPIDCPENPKYLHVQCHIYRPFMIFVQDQSGQVPLLVKNKAAEILFANIVADDAFKCYSEGESRSRIQLSETSESEGSSTPGMLDSNGKAMTAKRKRTEAKPDFHLVLLILIKCLLNRGMNSPFCFKISVNPEKNVEDGRFELVSLTMPIPRDCQY